MKKIKKRKYIKISKQSYKNHYLAYAFINFIVKKKSSRRSSFKFYGGVLETDTQLTHVDTFFVLAGVVAQFFGPGGEFNRNEAQGFDGETGSGVAAFETA